MIKIRIECEAKDVQKALEQLAKGYELLTVSREYKNRNNNFVRVYVDAEPKNKNEVLK